MRDENIANQTWQESKFIEGTLVPRRGKTDVEKNPCETQVFPQKNAKRKKSKKSEALPIISSSFFGHLLLLSGPFSRLILNQASKAKADHRGGSLSSLSWSKLWIKSP